MRKFLLFFIFAVLLVSSVCSVRYSDNVALGLDTINTPTANCPTLAEIDGHKSCAVQDIEMGKSEARRWDIAAHMTKDMTNVAAWTMYEAWADDYFGFGVSEGTSFNTNNFVDIYKQSAGKEAYLSGYPANNLPFDVLAALEQNFNFQRGESKHFTLGIRSYPDGCGSCETNMYSCIYTCCDWDGDGIDSVECGGSDTDDSAAEPDYDQTACEAISGTQWLTPKNSDSIETWNKCCGDDDFDCSTGEDDWLCVKATDDSMYWRDASRLEYSILDTSCASQNISFLSNGDEWLICNASIGGEIIPSSASCTDSDNGQDYYAKGTVIETNASGSTLSVEDSCINSTHVLERSCLASLLHNETFECPKGCNLGKCNPDSWQATMDQGWNEINGNVREDTWVEDEYRLKTDLGARFTYIINGSYLVCDEMTINISTRAGGDFHKWEVYKDGSLIASDSRWTDVGGTRNNEWTNGNISLTPGWYDVKLSAYDGWNHGNGAMQYFITTPEKSGRYTFKELLNDNTIPIVAFIEGNEQKVDPSLLCLQAATRTYTPACTSATTEKITFSNGDGGSHACYGTVAMTPSWQECQDAKRSDLPGTEVYWIAADDTYKSGGKWPCLQQYTSQDQPGCSATVASSNSETNNYQGIGSFGINYKNQDGSISTLDRMASVYRGTFTTEECISQATSQSTCNPDNWTDASEIISLPDVRSPSLVDFGSSFPSGNYRVVYKGGYVIFGGGFKPRLQYRRSSPVRNTGYEIIYNNGADHTYGPDCGGLPCDNDYLTQEQIKSELMNNASREFVHNNGKISMQLLDDNYGDNSGPGASFQLQRLEPAQCNGQEPQTLSLTASRMGEDVPNPYALDSNEYLCYAESGGSRIAECCGSSTGDCQTTPSQYFGGKTVTTGASADIDGTIQVCSDNGTFITDLDRFDMAQECNNASLMNSTSRNFLWTGTRCCGDEIETYVEDGTVSTGACLNGHPLRDDSGPNPDFPYVKSINGTLVGCNYTDPNIPLIEYRPLCTFDTNARYYCNISGGWVLDTDSQYKIKDYLSHTPAEWTDITQTQACCNSTECWNGSVCRPSQAGTHSFNRLDEVGAPVRGGYYCLDGEWSVPEVKISLDGQPGFCARDSQCLVTINHTDEPNCMEDGDYKEDNYCDDGTWSSRTKLLALSLLENIGSSEDFILYCGNPDQTLNYINYFLNDASVFALFRDKVWNNFCILQTDSKTILATSLNYILNDTSVPIHVTNIFPEFQDCDEDHTGYTNCDDSNKYWYNAELKTIALSTSSFTMPQPTTTSLFTNFEGNPLTDAITLLDAQTAYDYSFINDSVNFQRIYLQKKGNKQIFSTLDTLPRNNLIHVVTDYESITATDLCNIINKFNQSYGGNTGQMACIRTSTSPFTYDIFAEGNTFTDINLEGVWSDLTGRLRLT